MSETPDLLLDYLATFHTPSGERVLADLQGDFWYGSPMFQPQMTNDMDLAFREGQRSVIISILNTIEMALNVEPAQALDTHYHGEDDG